MAGVLVWDIRAQQTIGGLFPNTAAATMHVARQVGTAPVHANAQAVRSADTPARTVSDYQLLQVL